ncbi:MAG: hypothetical protein AB7O24_25305 [Kofleriaceae bacterium]
MTIGGRVAGLPVVGPLLATWRGRFIAVFFTAQLLLPLHYYLVRSDKHDERFAWRMFSPMRMTTCTASLQIDGQPARLDAQFHEAWVSLVARGRGSVIDAIGQRLCERNPGKPVELIVNCNYIDREPRTFGGHDVCATQR